MPDPIPDPIYVRYVGPGAVYQVRWTLGPYRLLTEAEHGIPVAVSPDVADALTARPEFDSVDPVEAVDEILAEEQRRAAEQAQWEERQEEARARGRRRQELLRIEAGRLEVMRIAASAERDAGGSQSNIVAAAATAESEYLAALPRLRES